MFTGSLKISLRGHVPAWQGLSSQPMCPPPAGILTTGMSMLAMQVVMRGRTRVSDPPVSTVETSEIVNAVGVLLEAGAEVNAVDVVGTSQPVCLMANSYQQCVLPIRDMPTTAPSIKACHLQSVNHQSGSSVYLTIHALACCICHSLGALLFTALPLWVRMRWSQSCCPGEHSWTYRWAGAAAASALW
jgi:hypothetical protein